ncbi:hypothetical protein B4102_4035 [Heyndrickxia sporothermodurans]|uniref:Uncharacterized protein n=1 Tax=Heyndrickxia sporothermodurans TaxID=46224 RepID=A0A150KKL7_9BACI|nr:type II toxin-antitoxin system PemK/MazF family toxin [Heyndrickxia sporothermodurans]KYC88503.1 hypothetical protein B4102_4035 [Heyndrickxia sporothermodurans]
MDSQTRKYFKNLTKKRPDGTRICDGKMAREDPKLALGLLDVSQNYANFVRTMKMHDAINLLLGLDLYSRDKQNKMYPEYKKISEQNFKKEVGRIVTVDFFGHFGTELAYEHPAIVLGSVGSSVLVAPISSPAYGDNRPTHVDLEPPVVTIKSAILLEKIRYISKNRILKKFSKISNTTQVGSNPNYGMEKLQEIDSKLAALIVPHQHKRFLKAEKDLEVALQDGIDKDKIIQRLNLEADANLKSFEALKRDYHQTEEDLRLALEDGTEKQKIIEELNSVIAELRTTHNV